MLTKKDKQEIQAIIRDELKEALFRKITIERGPRKQGDPEKVVKEEEWNVLDFLATYLPQIEGALRGMQEDIDHTKNELGTNTEKLQTIGQTLVDMEQAALSLADFSTKLKELGLTKQPKKLIDTTERKS